MARRYLNLWLDNLAGPEACLLPPRSPSGYAHFSGHIYVVDSHAPLTLTAAEARAYYEEQGMAVADVEASEDDVGIVLAGESVAAARPLSGDWRVVDGALELVAVVAFPGADQEDEDG